MFAPRKRNGIDETAFTMLAASIDGVVASGVREGARIDELRAKNRLATETVASGTILEIPVTGT